MNNLPNKIAEGISWSVYSQFIVQALNLVSWVFLARILTPNDFGLVTMILVISKFLQVFRNMGLSEALIHSDKHESETQSTVFFAQLILGALLSIALWLCSSFISKYYHEPLLYNLVGFFAIEFFIGSFFILPHSILIKKLAFKKIFILELTSVLISSLFAIGLALKGLGVMSLIYRLLCLTIISTLLGFLLTKWTPNLNFSFLRLQNLLKYGKPLIGSQTLTYFIRNLDDILVGRAFGVQSLGIYNRAYAMMLIPLSYITQGVSRVLFPSFSILKQEKEKISKYYLMANRGISIISFPLMIGLFVLADPLIVVLLNESWTPMIPIIKILSFVGMFQALSATNGSIFLALDKTKLQFKLNLISSFVILSAILVGIYYFENLEGLSWCYALASLLLALFKWYFIADILDISVFDIISNFGGTLVCSILMGITIYFSQKVINADSSILGFTLNIVLGVFIYLILLIAFNIKAFKEFRYQIFGSKI